MGPQRRWLFKHQMKRYVGLNHDLIDDQEDLEDKNGINLYQWKAKDFVDFQLLNGVFSTKPLTLYGQGNGKRKGKGKGFLKVVRE